MVQALRAASRLPTNNDRPGAPACVNAAHFPHLSPGPGASWPPLASREVIMDSPDGMQLSFAGRVWARDSLVYNARTYIYIYICTHACSPLPLVRRLVIRVPFRENGVLSSLAGGRRPLRLFMRPRAFGGALFNCCWLQRVKLVRFSVGPAALPTARDSLRPDWRLLSGCADPLLI